MKNNCITFLGEPWTVFGLIILLFGFIIIFAAGCFIRGEKEYDEEFKNYGE